MFKFREDTGVLDLNYIVCTSTGVASVQFMGDLSAAPGSLRSKAPNAAITSTMILSDTSSEKQGCTNIVLI